MQGLADLAVGEVALMAIDDSSSAIVARDQQGFYALSGVCPHACCTVTICGGPACAAPLSSTNSTPAETIASAGTLTLTLLTGQQAATGEFDLQFASDALSGSFNAAYCPEGHEP